MRMYLTHCSAKKDDTLKGTGTKVTPDRLYTATPTQRFIQRCRAQGVKWAIFSDLYGVWLPEAEHEWYEKDPDTVTQSEFQQLLANFDRELENYDEIWFYRNPGRYHPLYQRLLASSRHTDSVVMISHLSEIE